MNKIELNKNTIKYFHFTSQEIKEHVEEISSIAKESKQEYVESGKNLTTNNLHNYIQQNIQSHIQGQALQSEDN